MKEDGAPIQPFRPLSKRLVAWVLLYSAIFTLVMTGAVAGLHYLDERDEALKQLQFAAASYRKSLASSLWELDMPAARLQLDGLANFPMVGQAELLTAIGQRIHASKYAAAGSDGGGRPALEVELVSPEHPDRVVGRLRLYIDQRALLRRLEADALRILGGEAVKGLLFGMLLAWLITQLVTRHVSHIARWAGTVQPGAPEQPLALHRNRPPQRDELDQLADALNRLHQRLHQHIVMQKSLETQLREHRDGLAQMVADRTSSLERLREFHGMIITVLTRFINLPPEQASIAVDHGLAAFGGYFDAKRCGLLMHDDAARGYRIANVWPPLRDGARVDDLLLADDDLPPMLFPVSHAKIWISIDAADPATLPEAHHRLLALFRCEACTVVSIEVKGDTVGLLYLIGVAVSSDSADAKLLQLAAQVAANMLDHNTAQRNLLLAQQALQDANRELLTLSRHDPLTGLANRRQFEEAKDLEFRRALRAGSPLSVLMCDIDEFKRYNDTYGHAQGDDCLIKVSQCLRNLFGRAGEVPARLGGEEFAVLLPNVKHDDAVRLAENLRQAVWEMRLPHAASSVSDRVTISVGAASLRHELHRDFDRLLRDADEALYRAKETRNCVAAAC
ncbi:MAG TPA: diguanylate cyclase [Paucimonas sp.]|nr:diguanylate cyclase [Paucimonas sp.]